MLMAKCIFECVRPQDWFAAMDRKDVYFHVSILPRGRGISVPLREHGVRILNYLDDWLILAHSREQGDRLGRHVRAAQERARALTADLSLTVQGSERGPSETLSEAPGAYGIRSCGDAARIASYENASASRSSPEVGMASRLSPSDSNLPSDLLPVVEPQLFMGWGPSFASFQACRCLHGCLYHGLGSHVQWACSRGFLDRTPAPHAHQLPQAAGSTPGPAPLSSTAPGSTRTCPFGQYRYGSVYQPPGWSTLTSDVAARTPPPIMESEALEVPSCCLHSRRPEPGSRRAVTDPSNLRRMATLSPVSPADWEQFGEAQIDLFASRDSSHCALFYSLSEGTVCVPPTYSLRDGAPSSRALEATRVAPGRDEAGLSTLTPAVAATITSARASSTRHLYALKWNLFVNWCSSRGEDPWRCPINVVLSFLQEGLERRLLPSALKVYVAAIAASHEAVEESRFAEVFGEARPGHQIPEGSEETDPPRPPLVPSWDLSRVGDLHTFSVDEACLEFGPAYSNVILRPRPGYVPKVPTTPFRDQVVNLQALPLYFTSGDSLVSLAFSYRLGHRTVVNSVHMVCAAIEKFMMGRFLPRPTQDTWREVAQGFWDKLNFPNCLGAIDGKHVVIQPPPRSGSQYFNYKNTFSIVLLALVDADYRFRVIQVGDFGRTSDGGVYAGSDLGRGMESRTLHVPPSTSLPGAAQLGDMPFVMVCDAAFPLKPYLMRPSPGHNLTHQKRIFNYRLSRARMVVENAFGILASSENQRLLDEEEQLGRHMAPVRNM
ncbi:hypothetical protein F2P79_013391 [Pimephales promelas]|nr:hypothetical protein F2P79_013391 [Pimephales promelas]